MLTLQSFPALRLAKLRELLDLVALLRRIEWPIQTADDLRAAIAIVVRLGELVGVDPQWTARLQSILENPAVFDVVLAIARFLSSQMAGDATDSLSIQSEGLLVLEIDAQSFAAWLPIVLQILELIRQLSQSRSHSRTL
jgi:hypothetical protein